MEKTKTAVHICRISLASKRGCDSVLIFFPPEITESISIFNHCIVLKFFSCWVSVSIVVVVVIVSTVDEKKEMFGFGAKI